ncbi:hypothetical protein J5X98_15150 [Leptothermofonsia sichuanensis E412]|uniref:hypothetical protein n=1 Tax=Leptothermofonsia sichuanensis TaxID=2917832 RepID=UPI001CA6C63F|nr:hypothetical protein [Leptothermofonsia sichuanensis]QZZ18793.1 hypothetical protein J5X98_15150 [Leptothermofonsia sichuanensis E412]
MSGYFARLIQQTGLSVARAGHPARQQVQPSGDISLREPGGPSAPSPLEVEQTEEVVGSAADPGVNAAVNASVDSTTDMETEDGAIAPAFQSAPVSPRVDSFRVDSPRVDNPPPPVLPATEGVSAAQRGERELPISPPESAVNPSSSPLEALEQVEHLPAASPPPPLFRSVRDSSLPAWSSLPTRGTESPAPAPLETPTESIAGPELAAPVPVDDRPDSSLPLPPSRTAYLQAMWDWVGQNSTVASAAAKTGLEQAVEAPTENSDSLRSLPSPSVPPLSSRSETVTSPTLQTQDLILSIGTIQLTLETPPVSLSPPAPPPAPPPLPPPSDSLSSRLNRHYLRLG